MKRLIVALIAGAFAVTAAAQSTAPMTSDKAKMEKAEKNKSKQELVKGATASPEQQSGAQTAAEGKKNTEASKKTSKLSKSEKAKTVNSTTTGAAAETTGAASAAMAKKTTAASKSQPKLKDQETKAERAKTTGDVTKKGASQ